MTEPQNMENYFFLEATDSMLTFPTNKLYDFTIELPFEYDFTGEWVCGLSEFHSLTQNESTLGIYIFCDLCEDSFVKDCQLPILRRFQVSNERITFLLQSPYYIRVVKKTTKRIRIYITDNHLRPATFLKDYCNCTLHLKRIQK